MALEVGRQVAQPDAAALRRGIDLAPRKDVTRRDSQSARPQARVLEVNRRVGTHRQDREWRHAHAVPAQACEAVGVLLFEPAPVARVQPHIAELEAGRRQIGLAGQRLAKGLDRLLEPLQVLERAAEIEVGEAIARVQRRGRPVGGDGLGRLAHQLQQDAQVRIGLRIVGRERDGLAIGVEGLAPASQGLQGDGEVTPGLRAVGLQRRWFADARRWPHRSGPPAAGCCRFPCAAWQGRA